MRDQGAPARTADGEDLDHWTNERVARQRALRAAVLIDAIRCLVGAGGTRVPAGSLACAPDCSAIITVPHCARTVTHPCTADAQCPGGETCVAGCAACGNGFVDPGEECDEGAGNRDAPNHCRPDCTLPRCGDATLDFPHCAATPIRRAPPPRTVRRARPASRARRATSAQRPASAGATAALPVAPSPTARAATAPATGAPRTATTSRVAAGATAPCPRR